MSKLNINELVFEKETQNFARYRFERNIGSSEEVRGTIYLPKGVKNVHATIEYEIVADQG